jgi:hypothetical protein
MLLSSAFASLVLAVAGCGTPEYCSDLTELKQSLRDLEDIELDRGALPALRKELGEVRTAANAAIGSARQDYPSQTSAVESSLSQLSTTVRGLPASPSREQLRTVAPPLRAFVKSVQDLSNETRSACA